MAHNTMNTTTAMRMTVRISHGHRGRRLPVTLGIVSSFRGGFRDAQTTSPLAPSRTNRRMMRHCRSRTATKPAKPPNTIHARMPVIQPLRVSQALLQCVPAITEGQTRKRLRPRTRQGIGPARWSLGSTIQWQCVCLVPLAVDVVESSPDRSPNPSERRKNPTPLPIRRRHLVTRPQSG